MNTGMGITRRLKTCAHAGIIFILILLEKLPLLKEKYELCTAALIQREL